MWERTESDNRERENVKDSCWSRARDVGRGVGRAGGRAWLVGDDLPTSRLALG